MKNLDLNIFPQINKNQWLQLAEKQLKGVDPYKELRWKNDAGLDLNGYYDVSDLSDLKYLEIFFTAVNPHRWKLYERIETEEQIQANEKALKALMSGCDGIILNNPKVDSLDSILEKVNHETCDICIVSEYEINRTKEFTGFQLGPSGNCVSSREKQNPVEQIVKLLGKIKDETYIFRIALTDFFLEIATVRSLRYILESRGFRNIHIHTQVQVHNSDQHQWFLNTTSGLASILGGSHSINFPTAMGNSRISRNTGNLIREESGIEEYSDQCGGSYYIEIITDKIINEVTEKLK